MDAIAPDGEAVSLSAGRALLDPALWQQFAQGENNSLSGYKYNMSLMHLYLSDWWRNARAGKYLFVAPWPYVVMPSHTHTHVQRHTHLLAIPDLLVYNTLNPELFCITFDKHQMFSSSQNDFYGLKRRRHGDLGDGTQLFTIIYPECAGLGIILLRFLPTRFICPNTPGIIYKGCRNGERRAQSSEIRCRDWCFQECWGRRSARAYFLSFCIKWTIVLWQNICIFRIKKRNC